MPTDSNGAYSLPNGYQAATGETILASQHNPPLEDLAAAVTGRLPRSGIAPMSGPLKLIPGSAAAPSFVFSDALQTGLFRTSAGIGVAVSGQKVAELTSLPIGLGPLPWSGLNAPPLWVLAYGQMLSRTTYADLWAHAQTQIALGSVFWNVGNGSTTFGIGDARGRVMGGRDNMGGIAAGRLTTVVDGNQHGGVGGSQNHTLSQSEIPVFNPTFTGTSGSVTTTSTSGTFLRGGTIVSSTPGGDADILVLTGSTTPAAVDSYGLFTPYGTISSIGGGLQHNNTQPTMIASAIVYAGA